MSIPIFVQKGDDIVIEVYAWENNGSVIAATDKSQVPNDAETETITFTFKRPNYHESNLIAKKAQMTGIMGDEENIGMNVIDMQYEILRILLIKWDIKDSDGNDVPMSVNKVNQMQPSIARAAATSVLSKIQL